VRNLGSNALHALGHNGPQRGFIRQVSVSFSYFGFAYSYTHWKSVRDIFLVSFTASLWNYGSGGYKSVWRTRIEHHVRVSISVFQAFACV
jgi:hypothetical protein